MLGRFPNQAHWYARLLTGVMPLCVALLSLSACQAPLPDSAVAQAPQGPTISAMHLRLPAPQGSAGRRLQTLPGTWDQAEFIFQSPTALTADRMLTVPLANFTYVGPYFEFTASAASTPPLAPMRPSTDYRIVTRLKNGAALVAVGSLIGQTIDAGANTKPMTLFLTNTGAAGTAPEQVTIAVSGFPWFTNISGNAVTKLNTGGGITGTYATGAGTAPFGVAADASENVWVTNSGTGNMQQFDPAGNPIGGSVAVGTAPLGVSVDGAGNVWVANSGSNDVRKFGPTGTPIGVYSVGTGPRAIDFDSGGNAWVVNAGSNDVTKLGPSGSPSNTYGVGTTPFDVAVDASDNVWVTNHATGTVTKLDSSGSPLGTFGVGGVPYGIDIDGNGNAWVAIENLDTVSRLTSAGVLDGIFPVGDQPHGLRYRNGQIWVANFGDNTATRITVGAP